MKQDKILVVGAGAIGGFYGALLAKAGAEVSVVCRSDFETIKKQGYHIDSNQLGSWSFLPAQILKKANEYRGKADFILLCTKVTPELDRAALIQDAVSENTCIIFIQNGVQIEQELLNAFPNNEIISGLAFICCNRIKPATIRHLAYGKLTLGSLNPSKAAKSAQHICDFINQTGIEAITSKDIITSRWLKCLWNASFNPLSVLSDGLSTKDIISSQESLIRTIMQEVSDIALACGHPLPKHSIEENIKNTHAMPAYKTSMLLDFESGQTLETEAILGNAIKAAGEANIETPTLKTLYALLKLKTAHFETK